MAKSSTPIHIILMPGVFIAVTDQDILREKGHVIEYRDEISCDIILGPTCYNTSGTVNLKQLDILTKSTRALVRAHNKTEKAEAKRIKDEAKNAKKQK